MLTTVTKRKMVRLSAITCLCIMFIVILFNLTVQAPLRGGFNRINNSSPLIREWEFDLGYNSYYVAGNSDDDLFLANAVVPTHMVVFQKSKADTQHLGFRLDSSVHAMSRRNKIIVRPPYFFVLDGKIPFIMRGRLGDWQARRFMYDSTIFFDAVPIGESSAALRGISAMNHQNVLALETNSSHLQVHPELLTRQVDGLFCTEGMLHYSPELSMIVYVYRYRNQILCMDTTLNLISTFTTIDSISHAKVTVGNIKSENSVVRSGIPVTVNARSRVDGHLLYVQSEVLSKTEPASTSLNSCIIDVYDLSKKSYLGSFYLPKYNNLKTSDYYVYQNKFVAVYGRYIALYRLPKLD